MRPEALFDSLHENYRVRFANIKLADREVLRAICKLLCSTRVVGGFILDPELDGDSPLASYVARIIGASDVEEVARSIEQLCQLGLINVTSDYGIFLPSILNARAHSSAINGRLSIGRRRKHESSRQYMARAKAHRSGTMRSDLQDEVSNNLQRLVATSVSGKALAKVLRERPSGLPIDPTNSFERFEQTDAVSIPVKQVHDLKPALSDALSESGAEPKLDAKFEVASRNVESALSPTIAAALQDLGRTMSGLRETEVIAKSSLDGTNNTTSKPMPKSPTAKRLLLSTPHSSENQEYSNFLKSIGLRKA